MLLVLTGSALKRATLNDLKFRARVSGWACDIRQGHVFNFLMVDDEIRLANSICRVDIDQRISGSKDFFGVNGEAISCPKANCSCGYDIAIPKGRTRSDLQDLYSATQQLGGLSACEQLPLLSVTDDVRAFGKIAFLFNQLIHVDWFVGRRCNYDCSYCSPTIHDHTSAFPTSEKLKFSYDLLMGVIGENTPQTGATVEFLFHGGEPTLIPGYVEFLELIRDSSKLPVRLSTLTNFSRSAEFLANLNSVSELVYSLHLDYFTEASLLKLRRFLRLREAQPVKQRFCVKVMYQSGFGDVVERLFTELSREDGIFFEVTPLHDKASKEMLKYPESEKKYFGYQLVPRELR